MTAVTSSDTGSQERKESMCLIKQNSGLNMTIKSL